LRLCYRNIHANPTLLPHTFFRSPIDPSQLASLATEFGEEDRAFAEAGMSDYAAMLDREDEL
jgi:hypothetical protein